MGAKFRSSDAIENLSVQIAGAITSKDYTHHFEELRNTLKEHHMNLLYSVPESVTQGMISPHGSQ